ncbi:MAG: hypothetical protein H5U40_16100, partial [Polyangiaceae bacterium]|nr:hypothetical protein [Polyangiaceae bacterium]
THLAEGHSAGACRMRAEVYSAAMSPLGTIIIAWSAVYGYVCLYFILFWMRRRTDREYLAFGLLTGALSLYAVARAIRIDASSWEVSVFASELGAVGFLAMIPFLADFCREVAGGHWRVRALSYVWSAVGLLLVGLGSLTRSSEPEPMLVRYLPSGRTIIEAELSLWSYAYAGIGAVLASASVLRLLRVWKNDQDARVILGTTVLTLIAGVHDLVVVALTRSGLLFAEHVALASVFAMSYMLLDRFARTGRSLQERTAQLSNSYDELRATQEQLVRKEQLAAVGELSAVIAHEVRNPLAIIKNAVSGLRRSNLRPADQQTLLDILDEETDKLNRLMHDLLAYARPVVPKGRA